MSEASTPLQATASVPEFVIAQRPGENRSIFSLPGELRNYIYEQVLPNNFKRLTGDRSTLRTDGQICYSAVMRSNRQIYEETRSLLYTNREYYLIIHPRPIQQLAHWLGTSIHFESVHRTDFAAINNLERLCIATDISNEANACDVQDVLFRIFSFLDKRRQRLRKVKVLLNLDVWDRNGVMHRPHSLVRSLRSTRAGDSSPGHCIALLCDPFRTIRLNLSRHHQIQPCFEFLCRVGGGIEPWHTFLSKLETTMKSGDYDGIDYEVLSKHWQTYSRLCKLVSYFMHILDVDDEEEFDALAQMLQTVAEAHVRRDMEDLAIGNRALTLSAKQILHHANKWMLVNPEAAELALPLRSSSIRSDDPSISNAENYLREATYLVEELPRLLPTASMDLSGYGTAMIDRELRVRESTGQIETGFQCCVQCGNYDYEHNSSVCTNEEYDE
jgi:hypothetical protein